MDIRWSPTNAMVFASVSQSGRLELWNLEDSALDPIISLPEPEVLALFGPERDGDEHSCDAQKQRLCSVLFGDTTPIILSVSSICRNHEEKVI